MASPAYPSETREAEAVSRDGARTPAAYLASAYLALSALTVSPLLWASVPPLVDYPNHLARMWILVNAATIPDLASNYVAHWRLLPNLAMDLVVPALALVLPVETAGRVFIAITMLLLIGGTAALHRVLYRRVSFWPLSSLLFIYNTALFWGLLNFLFGAGVFLLALSGWIAARQWQASLRIVIFSIVATVLFVLHLFAFGLYGLSVMAYELGTGIRRTGWSIKTLVSSSATGIQFIPAVGLWIWLLATASSAEPRYTAYGSVSNHIYALLSPFTFGRAVALDGGFVLLSGLFLIYAVRRRLLGIAPEMRWPLLALLIAAILIPTWLNGSWLADARLPAVLPFLFIASTELTAGSRRMMGAFATIAVMLLATRVWAVSETWRDYDRRFTEFRLASQTISPGARLLTVSGSMSEDGRRIPGLPAALTSGWERSFANMGALAVIDRAAFIPNLFIAWTPVAPSAPNAGLFETRTPPQAPTPEALVQDAPSPADEQADRRDERRYWHDWPRHFDYVLWIDFDQPPPRPIGHLQLTASGSFFRIYRVLRP